MNYEIYAQVPEPKKICLGRFALSREGQALAMDRERKVVVTGLSRARVEFIGADGILISGFEEIAIDETGKPKFRYQEWWLRYDTKNE
jgi:hypothetical protein